jgi:hypothetical protein
VFLYIILLIKSPIYGIRDRLPWQAESLPWETHETRFMLLGENSGKRTLCSKGLSSPKKNTGKIFFPHIDGIRSQYFHQDKLAMPKSNPQP